LEGAEVKKSILIVVLCGPERHGWVNSSLWLASLEWTRDERFDLEFQRAFDFKTSLEARNWACGEALRLGHDFLLMIDNDTRCDESGRVINLLDLAAFDEDIVAAPVVVLQSGKLYVNAYKRMSDGQFYRSLTRDDLKDVDERGLLQVDAVGTGAIMIKRAVLEALRKPPIERPWWCDGLPAAREEGWPVFVRPRGLAGETLLGEDLAFCERAREAGFKCFSSRLRFSSRLHQLGHYHTVDLDEIPQMGLAVNASAGLSASEAYGLPPGSMPEITEFSITPEIARFLGAINDGGNVLELGSGISTLVLGEKAPVLSLESDESRARNMQQIIAQRGLRRALSLLPPTVPRAIVTHIPLVPVCTNGVTVMWYDLTVEFWERAAGLKGCIELLFIDGPAATEPLSRYPALPRLASLLAPGCQIVLDDANREGEIECVRRWQQLYPGLHPRFERVGSRTLCLMTWPGKQQAL
jgi:predicted O-methyltransferase YrrM